MSDEARAVGATSSRETLGWVALGLAIFGISWSPLFVRYADVGPLASAFWRMGLAMPALYLWARLSPDTAPRASGGNGWGDAIAAGLCFAADLAFFHLAIANTSITNAAFIANMASIIAVAASALLLKERVGLLVWGALLVALCGAWLMGGAKASLTALGTGDVLALGAAFSYAAYFIFIKRAQARISSAEVMWRSSLVAALALLMIVLIAGEGLLPRTLEGWLPLLGLGLVSHALGQGLTAFALGRLPVAPVALAVLSQPVVTTVLAFLILAEPMALAQGLGAAMILAALAASRLKSR